MALCIPVRFLSFSASTAPLSPERSDPPQPRPRLQPVAPGPRKTQWGIVGATVLVVLLAAGLWSLRQETGSGRATLASVRTAQVERGTLERTLRVGGAINAKRYAAIRAPRLRGPDGGGSSLTLVSLAEPGSTVRAGDIIAEFERRASLDHIDDVKSDVVQQKSDVAKRRAEIMISEESARQAVAVATGDLEKARLDLRTASVRSEIEAQILRLAVQEAEASLKQVQEEFDLLQRANQKELRIAELQLAQEENHLGRHMLDFEHMTLRAPISGLVVLMSQFRNGQFTQVAAGDQVRPGTLFMQVVDVSEMVLSAAVNQADVQSVQLGQKAAVLVDAYPDLVLDGEIVEIGALAYSGASGGNVSSQGTRPEWVRGVDVQIAVDSADPRIIPDLTGAADIVLSELPNRLIVPRSAIARAEEGRGTVHVREGSSFVERSVELGEVTDTHAVVVAGLSEGDVVALEQVEATP